MKIIFKYTLYAVVGFILNDFLGVLYGSIWLILVCVFNTIKVKNTRDSGSQVLLIFYSVYVLLATIGNIDVNNTFKSGIWISSYAYARPDFFQEASLIWILGNLSIFCGIEMIQKNIFPKVSYNLKYKQLNTLYYISYLLVFNQYLLKLRLPGSLGDFIDLIPLITVLFFAKLSYIYNDKSLRRKALLLCVTLVAINVLFSYLRTSMVLPIVVYSLGVLIGAKSFKPLFSVYYIPVYVFGLFFIAFFSVFGSSRSNLGTGISRLTSLQSAKDVSEQDIYLDTDNDKLTALQRGSTIAQLSGIVGLTNENGFYSGQATQPLVIALIPRFLWPEKPKIALGVWFALELGAAQKTDDWYNNSINMTIPGHLFIDFGYVGLIVGGLLIGVLFQLIWLSAGFFDHPYNITGNILGGYIIYMAFLGLGADLQIVITLIAIYMILYAFSYMFNRNEKNTLYRPAVERK